ncbi:MAG: PilZ domain-containing protein, partial [Candidatus Binataceae bacterium]
MSSDERRFTPRKACAIPLRFRILSEEFANTHSRDAHIAEAAQYAGPAAADDPQIEGLTINLSEHGICFFSRGKIHVGDPVEVFFRLPRELTGRSPEDVRCMAHVVHAIVVSPD